MSRLRWIAPPRPAPRAPTGPRRRRRRPARLAALERLEDRVVLSTFTVQNTDDSGPGSLRDAIASAIADLNPDPDRIEFAQAVAGTITLQSALPDLSSAELTLAGPGASVLTVARSTASGTPDFRIFTVLAGAAVDISGLTLTGGRDFDGGGGIRNAGTLAIANSTLSGNSTGGFGGGIDNSGTLTLTNSTLAGNSASTGGGGIRNAGTLAIANSTLSANSAPYSVDSYPKGGGIDNSGTLTITDSTLSGNSAWGFSGGIDNSGTLTLTNSTLSGNNGGAFGGGISNSGTLTLTNSTLSGNSAGTGGGIHNFSTLTLTNSTLAGNSARVYGGGIDNGGTLTVTNSTLSGNSAGDFGGGIANGGTLTLQASILAGGLGGTLSAGGSVTSLGHNLFSDRPGIPLHSTDLVNTDPLLGPLADNGGPTFTHALLPGSPAINAAVAVAGVSTDQRGIPRPQGPAPDIGAFELQLVVEPFVILTPSTGLNLVGTSHTVTARFIGRDLQPLAGVPMSFRVLAGPNAGAAGTLVPADGRTDAAGRVLFTYTGAGGFGTDTLMVSAVLPGGETIDSPTVTKDWTSLTVVNLNDSGFGSLRSAIELANRDPARDTIDFAPSVTGTITLQSPLPALSTEIILAGPGASVLSVARSSDPGTPAFRIFTVSAGATVEISGLTITGGIANSGGGIANGGTLTVTNSTLSGNSAYHDGGGGIANGGTATLTVTNSTLSGNSAEPIGGGIINFGMLTLTNSTLSGNSAVVGGGGIDNFTFGTLTVTNSTLSDNSAGDFGGGIANGGTLTLQASILAGGLGGTLSAGGSVTSLGHNLFSDRPGIPLHSTDLVNTDPLLGPLADNGGPTFTHALLPGSPAINAAVAVAGVTTDQRGIPRPQGPAPDIGAFEKQEPTLVLTPAAATLPVGQAQTVTAMLTGADGALLPGVPVTFRVIAGPNLGATGAVSPADGRTDAEGRARFTYQSNGGEGTDVILASATLPDGTTLDAPQVTITWVVAQPPPVTPPTVVQLGRLGVHGSPTTLLLWFSRPLDESRAEDLSNYTLVWAGADRRIGTRDDRPMALSGATYDAATNTVTLRPRMRLPLNQTFRLTVNGEPPGGLAGADGTSLDGDGDGTPGGDYAASFGREILVEPFPAQQPGAGRAGLREALQRRRELLLARRGAVVPATRPRVLARPRVVPPAVRD